MASQCRPLRIDAADRRLDPVGAIVRPRANAVRGTRPGARTTIELPENPSTGYVWKLDTARSSNASIVNVGDEGFSPAKSGPPIGAPGVHRWSIEGARAGSAKLIFVNMRPWEGQPVREHAVAVDVR